MNAMTRLIRIAIFVGVIVLLCGFLPGQWWGATVLPTVSVEAEPVLCLGGPLVEHCAEGGFPITNTMVATLIVDALLIGLFFAVARRPKLVPSGLQIGRAHV